MTHFKLMTDGKVAHEVEAHCLDDAARLFNIHMHLRVQSQPRLFIYPPEGCFGPEPYPPPEPPPHKWVTTLGVFHIKVKGQSRKAEWRMGKP